ncbi:uncharacterized protein HMPREF1541_02814 [Cyphellophora europaea CBS 101466]|uniref:IQ calmodulin-binding motif domain protein n=1 Tax=Cyphellophora europaea (strain CBS 101466) TaxID=1220924 RepID=W2S4X4_CYPE1|nr:uncharacterized protein HMPREF1541_02814 [Cyphellophora europaea CBS 101466]ETN43655.1 hypothetical protein HMPREF1541_02814 [Cyphellophora europaea CBS 101466]
MSMNPTTPPHEDADMALFADENGQDATPPPRVAARFYRSTSSRRRGSANSSRRSSISSLHSHYSNLSCHGGPRSTHIAQHLRRASIIETRKARLAERAAHAEQVRLRAAAAKAAPRTSHTEERAAAAQAAREKLLADIAARCEEEVRRAKRIAEENKERKAAEEARLREELAEKFAGAARRKTLYQNSVRRPRTTSLAAVEEKKVNSVALQKMSRTIAVKTIQRAYRAYQARKIISQFCELNVNIAHLANASFEEVTRLISEQTTMKATAKLLKNLDILTAEDEPSGDRGVVRVFLSAYLVLSHPMQALSYGGGQPQEQELMGKAKALIQPFESYIRMTSYAAPGSKVIKEQQDEVTFAFNDFTSAFHAWKSKDVSVLVEVMIGSFVNLDLIIQSTKDDHAGRVGEDYLTAIRQEQVKILARLKKIAGPEQALNKIRLAVRKARKQKSLEKKERSGEDHVPRSVAPSTGSIDSTPLTPPATPRPVSRTDAAPASYITQLGQTMTVLPTNREIAHEIQINGTFEVQQQPWTESRKHFIDALSRSMRDSMANDAGPTAASWTHAMAVLIREKLMSLVSQRHPLYDRIDGFLDPKLIDQQCRNGAFSYDSFFDTLAGLIAQLCSPGRDEIIKQFAEDKSADTIDRLFALINIIDLMSLDHINFQFRMASKSVLEHGHEHEHSMFERDLGNNAHTLEHTARWWRAAKSSLNTSSPSGNSIYSRGLTDLVLQNTHLRYSQLPETLRIDYLRILNLRAKAIKIVALSAILLTTKLRLQRNREALWTADKNRLMSVDLLNTDAARVVQLMGTSRTMPEPVRAGLLNFVQRVLPPAVAAARNAADAEANRQICIQEQRSWNAADLSLDGGDFFTEQIATYLLKSVREHVYTRLSASSAADQARVMSGAAETLARAGMPEWVAETGDLVRVMERVRTVDLNAHEKWYDQVSSEV